MYIIAHKLYEAQKRPSWLLIPCRMDHQQCFEHVVIPEKEAVVGGGKWYGGAGLTRGARGHPCRILPHHRGAPTPFKVGGKRMEEQFRIRGVLNHKESIWFSTPVIIECLLLCHVFKMKFMRVIVLIFIWWDAMFHFLHMASQFKMCELIGSGKGQQNN